MRTITAFVILVIFVGDLSCKKDNNTKCDELKSSIANNSVEKVKAVISDYISTLPSGKYNRQNIQYLVDKISGCDIASSVLCFDCIETLPSQTEISISFLYNGIQIRKVIDLSYSADSNIVFRNMHD